MPRKRGSASPAPAGENGEQLAILAEIARIATEDLELRPLLQRVTDSLAARFGWELVALIRVDREHRHFVCEALTSSMRTEVTPGYGRAFGSGVVGEVAATGNALLIDDAASYPGFVEASDGTRSELCAPIRHRGEVVAVLNLESPRLAAFRGQLPLVEAIADQIAGAIASARLLEATRQRAIHFELLSEVSREALGGADLTTVLERIVTYVRQRFDFFLVAIVVADETGSEWAYRAFATRGRISVPSRPSWPVTAGVVGRAIRAGAPQLVLDIAADPDYFSVSTEAAAEFVVPIRFGERILGAINVETDDAGAFSPENLRLLELVADQVAGAIQLALLNERLSEIKVQLEAANGHLQQANRSLERLSQVDPLTAVSNRRHFEEELDLEWRRLSRTRRPLSLLLADVDHFKAYNDAQGHIAGDRCLKRVASVLQEGAQRAGDLVARYGGEEFAVVLSATDTEGAARIAEQVRARLEELALPHPASPVSPRITISVGVASVVPSAEGSPAQLVAAADRALYRAKQEGRNRVAVGE